MPQKKGTPRPLRDEMFLLAEKKGFALHCGAGGARGKTCHRHVFSPQNPLRRDFAETPTGFNSFAANKLPQSGTRDSARLASARIARARSNPSHAANQNQYPVPDGTGY